MDELLPLAEMGSGRSYGSFHHGNHGRKLDNIVYHILNSTDTLSGVAIKYNVSKEDIKRINGLMNDHDIWLRKSLKIPLTKSQESEFQDLSLIDEEKTSSMHHLSNKMDDFFNKFDAKSHYNTIEAKQTLKRFTQQQIK